MLVAVSASVGEEPDSTVDMRNLWRFRFDGCIEEYSTDLPTFYRSGHLAPGLLLTAPFVQTSESFWGALWFVEHKS